MRVSSDNYVAGDHKAFLRQQRMLNAHRAYIIKMSYFLLVAEITASLALRSRLDILVRGEVVHNHCDLVFVKDAVNAHLVKLLDCNRGGHIVAQNAIEIDEDELAGFYLVKTCMSSEDLLRHSHSHLIILLVIIKVLFLYCFTLQAVCLPH